LKAPDGVSVQAYFLLSTHRAIADFNEVLKPLVGDHGMSLPGIKKKTAYQMSISVEEGFEDLVRLMPAFPYQLRSHLQSQSFQRHDAKGILDEEGKGGGSSKSDSKALCEEHIVPPDDNDPYSTIIHSYSYLTALIQGF